MTSQTITEKSFMHGPGQAVRLPMAYAKEAGQIRAILERAGTLSAPTTS